MKIAIIGTGYVGLVSGVCFAALGHKVVCIDRDAEKISRLKKGLIPIYEPGLAELLQTVTKNKKISFSDDLASAINDGQAIFIAVGTPQNPQDGSADLSFVFAVAREIAENISDHKIIITKSTVPVGTGAKIAAIIKKHNPSLSFSVASNPEFLREGAAIDDFMKPDRVVIGTADEQAKKILAKIYQPLKKNGAPIIFTDITSAELIKYAANSFLATKVAFINEMADLCEKVGADIQQLSEGIGLDSRIGSKFLNAGPGFGGSCFPKDILALRKIAADNNSSLSIVNAVIKANQERTNNMAHKINVACGGKVKGKTIAVLGLAFKAGTDDVRYSPSLAIIKILLQNGAKIQAFDEQAMANTKLELEAVQNKENFPGNITYHQNSYEAAKNADALVIATEWPQFKKLDLAKLKRQLKKPLIIDLRNILDRREADKQGFEYIYIGKKLL